MILGELNQLETTPLCPADIEINFIEFSAWGARPHKDLDITHSWKSGSRSANTFEVRSTIARASQRLWENRQIGVNIRLPPSTKQSADCQSSTINQTSSFDSAGYRYNITDQRQRLLSELILESVHRSQLQLSENSSNTCGSRATTAIAKFAAGNLFKQPHKFFPKQPVPQFEPEDPEEECSLCHDGGDLLICDGCEKNFHLSCVSMKEIPSDDDWFCPECLRRAAATSAPLLSDLKHNVGDIVWAQDPASQVHYPAQIYEIYGSPSAPLFKCFYISEPEDDGTLLYDIDFSSDRLVKWQLGRQLGAIPKAMYRDVCLAEAIRSGREQSPMYHQLEFEGGNQVGQLIGGALFDGGSEGKSETAALSMPNLEEAKDVACGICQQTNFSEEKNQMLLCDGCPRGYHMCCLPHPRMQCIPQGDWYCPSCVAAHRPAHTQMCA